MADAEKLKLLMRILEPDRPVREARLYVPPFRGTDRGCAAEVVAEIQDDPAAFQKFLLVGARGSGKSSELRQIARQLGDDVVKVSIDLDASGIYAGSVSAFDLLYLVGVAMLGSLEDEAAASTLFGELKSVYAGEERDADALGELAAALDGLAGFGRAAGGAADAIGLPGGGATAIAVGMSAVAKGVRLLHRNQVVPESSPDGARLLETCRRVARTVRSHRGRRPLCVLLDGLEKINGEAPERFRQVFEQTRLLAEGEWISVIAAPPSTLTIPDSATVLGYRAVPVWGFADAVEAAQAISLRVNEAELSADSDFPRSAIKELARRAGPLPRHVIAAAQATVRKALRAGASAVTDDHVRQGLDAWAEDLGRGVLLDDLHILRNVRSSGSLPRSDDAARLFATGRILASPPAAGSPLQTFRVHPLLEGDLGSDAG